MLVSVEVWKAIVRMVVNGGAPADPVTRMLRTLTVNKAVAGVARAELFRLGLLRVRCTVADIPRAIRAFPLASELCVFGGGDVSAAVLLHARAALESHPRFTMFLSDETERSNMAWLPRSGPEYAVICRCSDEKRFGDVVDGLAAASAFMKELLIDYLGIGDELPNLAAIREGSLRVTIQNADFDPGDGGWGLFKSPAVRELAFNFCDLVRMPPVAGFPNLVQLEFAECTFCREHDALESLSILPVPPIQLLALECCEYVGEVSLVAVLPTLKTLVIHGCRPYPDFDLDVAAGDALKAKLLSGELNAGGTGRLCTVIVRMLNILKAEREAMQLAQCDCCARCDCGECSDCDA
jgi:hypothetical protein